jgi:hypothetical protein
MSWILLAEEAEKPGVSPSSLLLIAIAAIAVLFLLRMSQRKRAEEARRGAIEAARRAEPREQGAPAIPHGQRDPEVARLYIEMNEFARELEGRLDTKIAYLKRLIADAERVMEGLNRALAGAAAAASTAPAASTASTAPTAPPVDPSPAAPPPAPTPAPIVDVTVGGGAPPDDPVPPSDGQDDIRKRIVEMAKAGKPKEAIAEEVGVPKGEVELVLSLHRATLNGGRAGKSKSTRNKA